jgi:hypothetical protein
MPGHRPLLEGKGDEMLKIQLEKNKDAIKALQEVLPSTLRSRCAQEERRVRRSAFIAAELLADGKAALLERADAILGHITRRCNERRSREPGLPSSYGEAGRSSQSTFTLIIVAIPFRDAGVDPGGRIDAHAGRVKMSKIAVLALLHWRSAAARPGTSVMAPCC